MLKRRIFTGFLFGLLMTGFILLLEYFTREHTGNLSLSKFFLPALTGGILSGFVFGFLVGRLPKRRYDE